MSFDCSSEPVMGMWALRWSRSLSPQAAVLVVER
eukprot:COSAG06_NODE_780_length_12362_cov_44.967142_3_plen_34_part_00